MKMKRFLLVLTDDEDRCCLLPTLFTYHIPDFIPLHVCNVKSASKYKYEFIIIIFLLKHAKDVRRSIWRPTEINFLLLCFVC